MLTYCGLIVFPTQDTVKLLFSMTNLLCLKENDENMKIFVIGLKHRNKHNNSHKHDSSLIC